MEKRLGCFLVDSRRGKRISIQFNNGAGVGKTLAFSCYNSSTKQIEHCINSSSSSPSLECVVSQFTSLSAPNGHFVEEIIVPESQVSFTSYSYGQNQGSTFSPAKWVSFSNVLEDEQTTAFEGEAMFVEDEGISVISDIGNSSFLTRAQCLIVILTMHLAQDDTIRISMVCDKKKLVYYSFLKKLRPVPGMAQLYKVCALCCPSSSICCKY